MDWLTPAIIASITGSALLFVVFAYLAATEREACLVDWAAAWGVYTIRLLADLWHALSPGAPVGVLLLGQAAAITYAMLLLTGTYRFIERRPPVKLLVAGGVSAFALTVVAALVPAPAVLVFAPSFLMQGVANIATGFAWWRIRDLGRMWTRTTAVSLVVWGLHKFDYPVFRMLAGIAPFGYMLSAVLALAVAFGVLISYFERTRRRLGGSEARYRALFENSASVMLVIDPADGRILDANRSAEAYYGWSRAELAAMHVSDINTLSWSEIQAEMAAAREQRKLYFNFRHRLASGEVRDVEVFSGPVPGEDHDLLYSIVHDATARVSAERELARHRESLEDQVRARTTELRAALEELQAATRAKDDFLTSMSHELRTPLNSVIGFAHVLDQELPGPLNAEQHKQVEMIGSAGQHLLALVNDVLDLAKIESGRLELDLALADVSALAVRLADAVEPLAREKGLSFDRDVAPDVTLETDVHLLEQILWNLLGNAVKYTERGQVRLSAARVGGEVVISVSDTGCGMTPDELDRAFDKFTRFRQAGEPGGTGLGLAIASRLAGQLGGTLEATSEPGSGSVFTLTLVAGALT